MSKRSLGVVIARFQAPSLTEAHRYLLEQVATRSSRVLVLLGTPAVPLTKRNPLEVSLRIRMVMDWWTGQFSDGPEAIVVPLHDRPSNEEWASQVDQIIAAVSIGRQAVVYCGPDGSGPIYAAAGGRHPVEVLDCAGGHASRIRAELLPRHTEDFRAGVIYAVDRGMLRPFMTIDAIIHEDPTLLSGEQKYLLAHKRDDGEKWRLIGGFVDVLDVSMEKAIEREVREETGLEVAQVQYVGSAIVDDWRYRGGPERIMTSVFSMSRVFGSAVARDDIDDLMWEYASAVSRRLHPVHQPLWKLYLDSHGEAT